VKLTPLETGPIASPRRAARFAIPYRAIAAVGLTFIGVALLVAALAANQPWLDRHFMPSFLLPRRRYVQIEMIVRLFLGTIGASFVFMARPAATLVKPRTARRALHIVIAAILAVVAAELVLDHIRLGPTEWLARDDEPRRQPNLRLGWTLVPARIGHRTIEAHTIEYAIDRAGYRVRSLDEPVDPDRPAIVFAGESMMFGEGLAWDESVPAEVGAIMGVQSANLAVHGYSTDQVYLRLQEELPRFRHPVAVVSLFMPALFGRNLDDDRPHLGPGLVWLPAVQHTRLKSLATLLVPYRRDTTVERGIAVTRDALRATVELARACGAKPLVVVPQFGREEEPERALRSRILDQADLPYTLVEINPTWRLPWDQHPDARASHAIASAIAAQLQSEGIAR
jgi:hypothetical protein